MADSTSPHQSNLEQRERLGAFVDSATDEELTRPIGDGWTVAAALAHLAFWDRFVVARWEEATRTGAPYPRLLADGLADLINQASLQQWLALPVRVAARETVNAAEAGDNLIARIDPVMLDEARANGRSLLIDRYVHRGAHLDQIESALGRRSDLPE